jgi:tetratricopeptide (TPR) repeat protein
MQTSSTSLAETRHPASRPAIKALRQSAAVPSALRSLALLCLTAFAVIPYLNALQGDFVFDDILMIRDNPVIQSGSPWQVVTADYYGTAYRPLLMLTYATNARIDARPFSFHVVNLLLHLAVTLTAWALLARLLSSPRAAWLAAALFAVHPVHTEAVSSIVGRAEILAALGVLVSLLATTRAVLDRQRSGRWLLVAGGAFAAGLLSKESAFTAIALAPLVHWWIAPRDDWRRRLAVVTPYAIVGLGYLALRSAIIGSVAMPHPPDPLDNPLAYVDSATRVRTAAIVLADYASLLIAPLRLSADYSLDQVPLALRWSDPRALAAFAILAALAGAAVVGWARRSELALAALLFAAPLALTANILFPIGTIKAERLLYLPSLGACLAAACLLARWSAIRPRATAAVAVALLTLFASRTWVRNLDWRDSRALFASAVSASPRSAKAHHNLGVALQMDGEYEKALFHYEQAIAIYPDYAAAAFGIGHLAMLRGDEATALEWLQRAVRSDWQMSNAHFQLGLLYLRHGQYTAAEAALRAALADRPDNPLFLVNLAASRAAQGDPWGAREILRRIDDLTVANDPETAELLAAARHEVEVAIR